MGIQLVNNVTLIRHAYVLTAHQRRGIGEKLLKHLMSLARTSTVLVGTWEAAYWAVRFYENHGFRLVPSEEKDRLLRKYWNIPERQIETSVVLKLKNKATFFAISEHPRSVISFLYTLLFIHIRIKILVKRVISVAQKKADKGKVSLKAGVVMAREVITIDENASVKEAADIMNQLEIGSIIATKKEKAIGIITERDLLKRIIAEGKNAKKTKVKDIMSSPLIVIAPNTDLEEAARLMFEKKIKKLAVIDQNRLVGVVSLTDIARVQPEVIKILQRLSATQDTPESIKKVLDSYIV
jgi:CBS domain-containing protein